MSGQLRLAKNGVIDEKVDVLKLQNIAVHCVVKNLDVVKHQLDHTEDIFIPEEVCHHFLQIYQRFYFNWDSKVLSLFTDTTKTRLKNVSINGGIITSEGLEIILRHNLHSLSLVYCKAPMRRLFVLLPKYGDNLRSLELVNVSMVGKMPGCHDFFLKCSKLEHLVLKWKYMPSHIQFGHMCDLTYLDFSFCNLDNISLQILCSLPKLKILILHDVWPLENQLNAICHMSNLQTLDISYCPLENDYGIYDHPSQKLQMLIEKLPNLTHLDISGTNLARNDTNDNDTNEIAALAARKKNPFKFLGLYGTTDSACTRENIPAIEIAGNANENQILTAGRHYIDRFQFLIQVFEDIFRYHSRYNFTEIHVALDVVLTGIDRHRGKEELQFKGCAAIEKILAGKEVQLGISLKNHLIRELLSAMEMNITRNIVVRVCLGELLKFSMVTDVFFEHQRLVKVFVRVLQRTDDESKMIAMRLLLLLTQQVKCREMLSVNDFGVVSVSIIISKYFLSFSDHKFFQVTRSVIDISTKAAWIILYEVCAEDCTMRQRFLESDGVGCILRWLDVFSEREVRLLTMSFLLMIITQSKYSFAKWNLNEFVQDISTLLGSDIHEESYSAAYVLAIIAFDGSETFEGISREEVLNRMVEAMEQWSFDSKRTVIKVHNFKKMLEIARCYETPQCQYFAVWTMANLTFVTPSEYCQLIKEENGIQILIELLDHPRPYETTKELARRVIFQCTKAIVHSE